MSNWARYAGLGVQFAATIGVFVALGIWADGKWGTSPWFVLLGVGLGFTGALLALLRAVPPPRRSTDRAPRPPTPTPPSPPTAP
jgi:F0F1-type ATP synthase assembly protein I